jgi:hypothetical protein
MALYSVSYRVAQAGEAHTIAENHWRTEGGDLGGSNPPPPEIPKFWRSTKN